LKSFLKIMDPEQPVTPLLIQWLETRFLPTAVETLNENGAAEALKYCKDWVLARDKVGRENYGKPLTLGHLKAETDMLEELADALQYGFCGFKRSEGRERTGEEKEKRRQIYCLILAIAALLEEDWIDSQRSGGDE
jgi:hypothetical protein